MFLSGGVNKVTVTGTSGNLYLDRLRVSATSGTLRTTWYEAESATLAGTATVIGYPSAAVARRSPASAASRVTPTR